MKTKFVRQRLKSLLVGLILTLIGAGLLVFALQKSMVFYYTPAQLTVAPPLNKWIRLGGQVKEIRANRADKKMVFWIEENNHKILVTYQGALPPLFRLGQGIIAEGKLITPTFFAAQTLLVKHDENYRPPKT